MHVNTQKTSWAWYEYVCARCRGELQFAHISNSPMFSIAPHVEGRITIRPYACVFWTFANMHVNTQKTLRAWYEYVCVCCRGELQFAHVFNSPLHVCYPNVGKYHVNTCKYACKYTKKGIMGMV